MIARCGLIGLYHSAYSIALAADHRAREPPRPSSDGGIALSRHYSQCCEAALKVFLDLFDDPFEYPFGCGLSSSKGSVEGSLVVRVALRS